MGTLQWPLLPVEDGGGRHTHPHPPHGLVLGSFSCFLGNFGHIYLIKAAPEVMGWLFFLGGGPKRTSPPHTLVGAPQS